LWPARCGNSRSRDGNSKNIFAPILDKADKENTTLTDANVRNDAGNLIVGGSDSTAVTITYLAWAIMSQLEIQHQLGEEGAGLPDDFGDTDGEVAAVKCGHHGRPETVHGYIRKLAKSSSEGWYHAGQLSHSWGHGSKHAKLDSSP
jgi:hypothetical protein